MLSESRFGTRGGSRVFLRSIVGKSYIAYLHAPWRVDRSEPSVAACLIAVRID